jgi:hypothetical protein
MQPDISFCSGSAGTAACGQSCQAAGRSVGNVDFRSSFFMACPLPVEAGRYVMLPLPGWQT